MPVPEASKNATSLTSVLSQLKLPERVSYRLFPVEKNSVEVRFDNLADLVDAKEGVSQTQYINIEQFADDLYFDENGMIAKNVEIQEMSLQGVYPLREEKRKEWTTEDNVDHKVGRHQLA